VHYEGASLYKDTSAGATVKKERYKEVLACLHEAVCLKCPEI
jgi:hypothetical protein